jgi:release factor glutamine methyltransferase
MLNGVEENITFVNTGIDEYLPAEKFDLIVSNPPYVSKDEYQNLQPEIVNFEPVEAVTDNNDGFYFYNLISEKAKLLLKRPGILYFELGAELYPEVKKIMESCGFENVTIKKDYLNIERVIYGELN